MGNAMGRYAVGRSGTRIPYCHREGIQRLAMTIFFIYIRKRHRTGEESERTFEESDIRIFCHQIVHNSEHIILYFRITQIQNQLVTEIILVTVRKMNHPVFMLFIQLTLRIHHFRFNPDTELYTFFLGGFRQITNAMRKLVSRFIPVT